MAIIYYSEPLEDNVVIYSFIFDLLNLSNNFNTERRDVPGLAIPFIRIFISIFVLPRQRYFSQVVPKGSGALSEDALIFTVSQQ